MKLPDVRCACPTPLPMTNKRHCLSCGFQLPTLSPAVKEGIAAASPAAPCPNCESAAHARCCSWCGKVHKPKRLHHEHCSTKCAREAEHADQFSAAMEETT